MSDGDDPLQGRDEHELGDEHAGHEHGEAGTHDHHHHDVDTLAFAVFTVSSSRSATDDVAGDAIVSIVEDEEHTVATREVVPDDFDAVQEAVAGAVNDDEVDAVVTTGGTGVTPDDVTIEAVTELFVKDLPGFGELFRQLSRDEVGTRVVGTRAAAGIARPDDEDGGVPLFSLPGSENAARLGVREIVVREAPHLAGLARR
jgi:molybdenum cofactor biosynthesis protein B